ncbi:MAG: chemotaxis protein CheB [Sandaracinus sp.]|nr:chemotaxis protein CheB [Sandaracinus sp.]MCB9632495.1 chemotaxis protein CheB [Sandaracinus sp.]
MSAARSLVPPGAVPRPEHFSLVLVAGSAGAPGALRAFLGALSPRFHAAVVVVQHMPSSATPRWVERLGAQLPLPVVIARDGMTLARGRVHVAPGGRHLELHRGRLRCSAAPPEHGVRPAADVLFRSAWPIAHEVVALVLSGMGCDGLEGARGLRERGARVLAQDDRSSVVWGMPGEVVRAGLATSVGHPTELGALLEGWSVRARLRRRLDGSVKGSTPPGAGV